MNIRMPASGSLMSLPLSDRVVYFSIFGALPLIAMVAVAWLYVRFMEKPPGDN